MADTIAPENIVNRSMLRFVCRRIFYVLSYISVA